jgi:hypothetical protein
MPSPLRWLAPLLLFPLATPSAHGQDTPAYEVFAGATYAREDINNAKLVNGKLENQYINAIGWHASVTGNGNSWIGAVFDFSGVFSNPRITLGGLTPVATVNTSTFNYLFGPRFTYRHMNHITPFAEALFGPSQFRFTSSDLGITNVISATAFATALGGGVDVPLNHTIALRVIHADYILTRFRELGIDTTTGLPTFNGQRRTQNNLRASAGVVFHFGSK